MKIRNSTYPEVEECVRKWFVQCRDQNLPDYKAGDVFNADETELFFQRLANKTAAFKGEECHGGKKNFLDVDNELQTCGTMTDKEIVANINAEISDEENEELDQQEHEKVTLKEAWKAVELLR
ncbi:hypothetical protein AVEN_253164-1 [Araneus ventricosus]|uniref:HTH CENPB-type domain-containing protein n=1 Tax=Araneus ventricosus TaxID=182803 RepID=A0A4Y2F452_ARAVE|nr:hypothetical protein AVEN_253164-1 [Araneus ventricosus]